MKVEARGNIKRPRREWLKDKETGEVTEIITFSFSSEDLEVADVRQLVHSLPGDMYAKITIESPQAEMPVQERQ